ncbi:MAG: glycosyltransferase family 1 protein [Alphaproteobacteria bacterium]|nr:glycosyltransferase family 1 protein [Alphaproteobacteria bacterium]
MSFRFFGFANFKKQVNFLVKSKGFRYGAILILVILLGIKLSASHSIYIPKSSFFDFISHKNLRVILVSPFGKFGEQQAHRYMCSSLKKLGYSPICVYSDVLIHVISHLMDIDVCISSEQKMFCPENSYNCLIVHWRSKQIKKRYDAILSIIPEDQVREICPEGLIIPFFFSVPATKFSDNPKERLFFGGCIWDKYRKSVVRKLYEFLDNTNYFDLYGVKNLGISSYKGCIPFGENTVLKIMEKSGITLVLHSGEHFENNIPTARIFEAAAASTVVITDRLPFIVKNFGDSVLYIDRDKSPEEIFRQIDAHMQWILSHPQEAIELARRSHEIFLQNFTLEQIMKKVMDGYKNSKEKSNSIR